MNYDQLGQKLSTINTAGQTLEYVYDLRGNIVQTKQSGIVVTSSAYDDLDRKNSETDANGVTSTWNYDYFGRLMQKVVVGTGINIEYEYDLAGRLQEEHGTLNAYNSNGSAVSSPFFLKTYGYDQAGQLTSVVGESSVRVGDESVEIYGHFATYGYDLAGRRISESTSIRSGTRNEWADYTSTTSYQNQTMEYDRYGQMSRVTTADGLIINQYDAVGNLVRRQEQAGASALRTSYFAYDAMNRQTLFDGAANGNANDNNNLTDTRGLRVEYDLNGNRIHEVSGSGGYRQIDHEYDALNRLTNSLNYTYHWNNGDPYHTFNGELKTWYDNADRVVAVELSEKDSDNNKKMQLSKFNSKGQLQAQAVVLGSGYGFGTESLVYNDVYDPAGNLTNSTNYRTGHKSVNVTTYRRYADGYKQLKIETTDYTRDTGQWNGSGQIPRTGTTNFEYDAYGFLTAVSDAHGSNDQTIFNDVNGLILQTQKNGAVTKNILVNGLVTSSYTTQGGVTSWTDNPSINSGLASGSQNLYRVNTGDSLRSIALVSYGDAQLWYLIADANGIRDGAVQVGETLVVPKQLSSVHNNSQTFTPYNSSRIIGDTSPSVPYAPPTQADNTCATTGIIIAAVLAAVVLTVVTAGIASMALAAAGGAILGMSATASAIVVGATAGAVGATLGSMASQGILVAGGLQRQMDWKEVGISAISGFLLGGVSAGVGVLSKNAVQAARLAVKLAGTATRLTRGVRLLGASFATMKAANGVAAKAGQIGLIAARAVAYGSIDAAADIAAQGISLGAGLQEKFDWSQTATAFVAGAGTGDTLGGAERLVLKNVPQKAGGLLSKVVTKVAVSSLTGMVGNSVGQGIEMLFGTQKGFDAATFGLNIAGAASGGVLKGVSARYFRADSAKLAFAKVISSSLGNIMWNSLAYEPGSEQFSRNMQKMMQKTAIGAMNAGFIRLGRGKPITASGEIRQQKRLNNSVMAELKQNNLGRSLNPEHIANASRMRAIGKLELKRSAIDAQTRSQLPLHLNVLHEVKKRSDNFKTFMDVPFESIWHDMAFRPSIKPVPTGSSMPARIDLIQSGNRSDVMRPGISIGNTRDLMSDFLWS